MARKHTLSFEVMPPRSVGNASKFWECTKVLSDLHPDFISITYGAGGNDRSTSLEVTSKIVSDTPVLPLTHLTCIDTPKNAVESIASSFLASGVRMFLALRGDPPKQDNHHEIINLDTELVKDTVELTYLLRTLDKKIQRASAVNRFKNIARPLVIAVAAFPDGNLELGTSVDEEIDRLLAKQDAGADFAITQLYYEPEIFARFMDRAQNRGVTIPVIAGILPTWSVDRLMRTKEHIGVTPPSRLLDALAAAPTDNQREEIGLEFWADVTQKAIEAGSPGVHMFTFNKWECSFKLAKRLDL